MAGELTRFTFHLLETDFIETFAGRGICKWGVHKVF